MSDWATRPSVEANLLNPALIALLIGHAADGYQSGSGRLMVWPLSFLVPPIVLHRPTRQVLPRDTRTHFATWTTNHSLLVAGFPRRAAAMTDLTREGLRMGLRTRQIVFSGGDLIATSLIKAPKGELAQLLKAAALVGRWLGRLDQPSTAFALLGVSP